MSAKPMSLADRIRAQRRENRSETEVVAEKEILNKIIAPIQTTETEQKLIDKKRGTPKSTPPVPHGVPQGTPPSTPKGTPRSTGVPHGVPQEVPPQVPRGVPQTAKQQKGTPRGTPVIKLQEKQAAVYEYLLENEAQGFFNARIAMDAINNHTFISINGVRKALKRLKDLDIIETHYTQGESLIQYTVNHNLKIICTKLEYPKGYPTGHPDTPRGTPEGYPKKQPFILEEENNLILLFNKIEIHYPSLKSIGLETQHGMEIIEAWKLKNHALESLPESLERANWAIENDVKDSKGEKLGLGYIYKSLLRGPFAKPQGYKSPSEIAIEEQLAEQKAIKAKRQELFNLAFENWERDLTEEKRSQITPLEGNKYQKRTALQDHFKNNEWTKYNN